MPRWARFIAATALGAACTGIALVLVAAVAATDRRRFWTGLWDELATAAFFGLLARIWLGLTVALAVSLLRSQGRGPALGTAGWAAAIGLLYSGFLLWHFGAGWAQAANLSASSIWFLFWRHGAELAAVAAAAALGGWVAGAAAGRM